MVACCQTLPLLLEEGTLDVDPDVTVTQTTRRSERRVNVLRVYVHGDYPTPQLAQGDDAQEARSRSCVIL